jgi:predicted DNA-binding transcriptional regulator AlpA
MAEHLSPFVWNTAGQMLAPIIWVGTTTTTGGVWSIDYTSAGFISAPYVVATTQLSSANVYDRSAASLSTAPSTTTAAGYGVRWANLLVLGATARNVPDGTAVQVIAIGETFSG